jgi:hypothetical protein
MHLHVSVAHNFFVICTEPQQKVQFLQQKGPDLLLKKSETHRPGKRQHMTPLAKKAGPHKPGKRQCVTHQEDSEPVLADTDSESLDDGVVLSEQLCDDKESDKRSEVSKEDNEEGEEKEDDEDDENEDDEEDQSKGDNDKHGDADDDDEDDDGERQDE